MLKLIRKFLKKPKIKTGPRAGFIPYYFDSKGYLMICLMIPSDPKFGGPHYQIAKGRVDNEDDLKTTAIREAEEELGLIQSNLKNIEFLITEEIETKKEIYDFSIYIGEILDPTNFNKPHYETGFTSWLSINDALGMGRPSHKKYFQMLKNKFGARICSIHFEYEPTCAICNVDASCLLK